MRNAGRISRYSSRAEGASKVRREGYLPEASTIPVDTSHDLRINQWTNERTKKQCVHQHDSKTIKRGEGEKRKYLTIAPRAIWAHGYGSMGRRRRRTRKNVVSPFPRPAACYSLVAIIVLLIHVQTFRNPASVMVSSFPCPDQSSE